MKNITMEAFKNLFKSTQNSKKSQENITKQQKGKQSQQGSGFGFKSNRIELKDINYEKTTLDKDALRLKEQQEIRNKQEEGSYFNSIINDSSNGFDSNLDNTYRSVRMQDIFDKNNKLILNDTDKELYLDFRDTMTKTSNSIFKLMTLVENSKGASEREKKSWNKQLNKLQYTVSSIKLYAGKQFLQQYRSTIEYATEGIEKLQNLINPQSK